MKLNVDAAIFLESLTFSVAGILRDSSGTFIDGFSCCHSGLVTPELGEAMGVREALSWIKTKNLSQVLIETDSLLVVQALRSNISMASYFGCVIDDCKRLWKDLNLVSIYFVKRSANEATHALAKASSSIVERTFLRDDLPSRVLDVILEDCYL